MHEPPPAVQRFLSTSETQENDVVMTGAVSVLGVEVGGLQVAIVNASTSLKMKNFGNVPPRLDTLFSEVRGIG